MSRSKYSSFKRKSPCQGISNIIVSKENFHGKAHTLEEILKQQANVKISFRTQRSSQNDVDDYEDMLPTRSMATRFSMIVSSPW